MEYVVNTIENLLKQTAFFNLSLGNLIMIVVACGFLYLAIGKQYEPLLLLPISFGMLLVNVYPPIMEDGGLLYYFLSLIHILYIARGNIYHPYEELDRCLREAYHTFAASVTDCRDYGHFNNIGSFKYLIPLKDSYACLLYTSRCV